VYKLEQVKTINEKVNDKEIAIFDSIGYSGPVGPSVVIYNNEITIIDTLNDRLISMDFDLNSYRTKYTSLYEKTGVAGYQYLTYGEYLMLKADKILYIFKEGSFYGVVEIGDSKDFFFTDDILFYSQNEKLFSIPHPKGSIEENREKILDIVNIKKYIGRIEQNQGANIIIDDKGRVFYNNALITRDYSKYYQYLQQNMGSSFIDNKEHFVKPPKESNSSYMQFIGTDSLNNTYWNMSGAYLWVFDKKGIVIDWMKANNPKNNYALHPSGDIYALDYNSQGVILNRIQNVWDPEGRKAWYDAHGGDIVPAASTSPKSQFASTTDPNVRMRSEPNVSGKLLVELAKGTELVVLDRSEKKETISGREAYWYKVRRKSDGLEGWLFRGFLKIE
jgi:hypothetical protein